MEDADELPPRSLVYTVDGFGKTTFGAAAPLPIFIASEKGLQRVRPRPKRFPQPETFREVLDAIDVLIAKELPYRTLVIDTLDWLEPLIWADVCRREGASTIEEVGGGYQKGYIIALDAWRAFLTRLERLWEKRRMEIILLAHCTVTNFKNPAGPDYQRYVAAIHQKAYDLVKQWVDVVMFGNYEEIYVTDDGKTGIAARKRRVKGVSTNRRLLYTERTAAYDAKNRLSLPAVLPLDYTEFAAACRGESEAQPSPEDLYPACIELADQLKYSANHKARVYVEANRTNVTNLTRALNSLRVAADEAAADAASTEATSNAA